MKYRPEIDGLRAIAVMPVILFHAGFSLMSGGFAGVDVFFVISGYLISSIILSEVRENSFTFAGFYERRLRRILPALAVVVLASLVTALLFALPEQSILAAESSIVAMLGVSNIYFWMQSGYFAPASEFSLLLHTWSLGVEEQFYLILPPVLLFMHRFRWNSKAVISVTLPVLFAVGVWLSYNKPSVAFYLLPARAWELGLGVALAVGLIPPVRSTRSRSLISAMGFGAILISMFVIDPQTTFPGWAALLPCLGTAAVIHSSSQVDSVGRLLSITPVRFIGLISYSLYLWHWPVFVGLRLYIAEIHLPPIIATLGVLLSVVLATITWRYVETPFRSRSAMPFKRAIRSLGALTGMSAALAVLLVATSGLPERLDRTSGQYLSAAKDVDSFSEGRMGLHAVSDPNFRFGDPKASIDFVLTGDSHAAAIRPAIEEWAVNSGRAGTILWRGACPILSGAENVPDYDGKQCMSFKEDVLSKIEEHAGIKTVFLAGRWEALFTGIAPEVGGSYRTYLIDEIDKVRSPRVTKRVFERAIRRTCQRLEAMGSQVIIIGAVPEVGFDVPRILALASHNQGRVTSPRIDSALRASVSKELDLVFDRVSSVSRQRKYISIWKDFWVPELTVVRDGIPLYRDDDHLTATSAREIFGPVIEREMAK